MIRENVKLPAKTNKTKQKNIVKPIDRIFWLSFVWFK